MGDQEDALRYLMGTVMSNLQEQTVRDLAAAVAYLVRQYVPGDVVDVDMRTIRTIATHTAVPGMVDANTLRFHGAGPLTPEARARFAQSAQRKPLLRQVQLMNASLRNVMAVQEGSPLDQTLRDLLAFFSD